MTRARDVSSRGGLIQVIPTSLTVGSGSGSVGPNGAVTFSGASSVTLNGCFTANYDSYKIVFSNIIGTQGAAPNLRIGSAAAGYYACQTSGSANYSGSTILVSQINNGSGFECGMVYDGSSRSGATLEIQNPFLSVITAFQSIGTDSRTGGAGARVVSGFLNNTTSYTDFYVGSGGGNFSGTIRVYGYNNG
jgi:hypothetical protein